MNWIEVTLTFPKEPEDWSFPVSVVHDLGCPTSRIEENPPRIITSLMDLPGAQKIIEELTGRLRDIGAASVETRNIPDEDWAEIFRQNFTRIKVGQRLLILPTWDEDPIDEGSVPIRLDPGQAFGTGEHPTTQMCLKLLEGCDLKSARVADLGCGSGVLAIGAGLMGAAKVDAFDIDPASVEAARENAELNAVSINVFEASSPQALASSGPYDVAVSNIISAVLISFAKFMPALIAPGGTWIVSGVIPDNWPDVQAAVERAGFELVERLEESGWLAARFEAHRK